MPLSIRRRPGRNAVVTLVTRGEQAAVPARADPALARAFRYQKRLDEGRYASISEMAAAEKTERGYLGSLLRLTLPAPDIVQGILDGRQPGGAAPPRLLQPLPAERPAQPEAFVSG